MIKTLTPMIVLFEESAALSKFSSDSEKLHFLNILNIPASLCEIKNTQYVSYFVLLEL